MLEAELIFLIPPRGQIRFSDSDSKSSLPPPARKEMPEHLQRRSAVQLHHLRLHQQEALQAQILRRVHGRALLHPLQVQDRGRGVRVSQRDGLHVEDAVDPGLLLQPQLQKPQRHLYRAGELLWLLGNSKLTGADGAAFCFPDVL